MGYIPYESNVDVRTGNANTPRLTNSFTADSYGAGQARSLMRAGEAVGDAGVALEQEHQRKVKEQTLYNVSTADFSPIENELQKTMKPDGAGYKDAVKQAYENWVEDQASNIEDDSVRQATKNELLARLPSYVNKADTFEQASLLANSKQNVDAILGAQQNRVLSDPSAYEDALKWSHEAIDVYAGKIPTPQREAMKVQKEYDLNKTYFDGKLAKAKNPTDLDAVKGEMSSEDWQSKLMPKDYEDLSNKIDSAKKVYENKISAEVKTKLTDLEGRSTDPTVVIPQEELASVQKLAAESGDDVPQRRVARIMRNQMLVRSDGRLTLPQLKQRIEDLKTKPTSGLSGAALQEVGDVAVKYDVSPSFLAQGLNRESDGTDPKVKNPDSTATGAGQFLESTWLGLMKDPAVAKALGVTPEMSKATILALRGDRKASIEAMAILAKQNKAYMEPKLGHKLDDTELYLGHFLGQEGAVTFIQALQNNPETIAQDLLPEAAASNKNVFVGKEGPRTVAQMYTKISESFANTADNVAAEDIKVYQAMYDKQEKALNGDGGMEYANGVGVTQAVDLGQEGGYALLGQQHRIANAYFKKEVAPFTAEQVAGIQQTIQTGTADQALRVLAGIQTMGLGSAKAAFKQLKVKNPAFGQAGLLALDGDPATAADIVRGQRRMIENPAAVTGLKFQPDTAAADFENAVGASLARVDPSQREAVKDAALAYLVETKGSAGKVYKKDDYQEAVKKVIGGRMEKVNGEMTFLPTAVPAKTVELLLSVMDVEDYTALSPGGNIPLHQNGEAIDPRYYQDEFKLRAIGDNKYYIIDADGSFVGSGQRRADGTYDKFVLELDPKRLTDLFAAKNKKMKEAAAQGLKTQYRMGG